MTAEDAAILAGETAVEPCNGRCHKIVGAGHCARCESDDMRLWCPACSAQVDYEDGREVPPRGAS